MPCGNHDHDHPPWPVEGAHEFVIEACETHCGWCKYQTKSANNLRVHARRHVANENETALRRITIGKGKAGRKRVQMARRRFPASETRDGDPDRSASVDRFDESMKANEPDEDDDKMEYEMNSPGFQPHPDYSCPSPIPAQPLWGSPTIHDLPSSSVGFPGLKHHVVYRIHESIIQPLLANEYLKDFYQSVRDCQRRVKAKEIVCLRDLEKTLIFMASEKAQSVALYFRFCFTSLRFIQATVEFLNDSEQTRPHDRPYSDLYFKDLVEQIKQYAQQIRAAKDKKETGEKLNKIMEPELARPGCVNCVRRKENCDEQRPECNKCLRAGFLCQGYLHQDPHDDHVMEGGFSDQLNDSMNHGQIGPTDHATEAPEQLDKNAHAATESGEEFLCDYHFCAGAGARFTRKEHYIHHLQGFHKEDIGWTGGKWPTERKIHFWKWRCSKCLIDNIVKISGWECDSCEVPCEEDRIRARQKLTTTTDGAGSMHETITSPVATSPQTTQQQETSSIIPSSGTEPQVLQQHTFVSRSRSEASNISGASGEFHANVTPPLVPETQHLRTMTTQQLLQSPVYSNNNNHQNQTRAPSESVETQATVLPGNNTGQNEKSGRLELQNVSDQSNEKESNLSHAQMSDSGLAQRGGLSVAQRAGIQSSITAPMIGVDWNHHDELDLTNSRENYSQHVNMYERYRIREKEKEMAFIPLVSPAVAPPEGHFSIPELPSSHSSAEAPHSIMQAQSQLAPNSERLPSLSREFWSSTITNTSIWDDASILSRLYPKTPLSNMAPSPYFTPNSSSAPPPQGAYPPPPSSRTGPAPEKAPPSGLLAPHPSSGSENRNPSGVEPKKEGRCTYPECKKLVKDLAAHMLTHQNERPRKCPIKSCDYHTKGFSRKYDRNRHALTHYKGVLVCGFCSMHQTTQSFTRVDAFKKHLGSVHNVDQNTRTPPNHRKKAPLPLDGYATPGAPGKCSTCSHAFANAQDFYEHLDECVLRLVEQEEPLETINAEAEQAISTREHRLARDMPPPTIPRDSGPPLSPTAQEIIDVYNIHARSFHGKGSVSAGDDDASFPLTSTASHDALRTSERERRQRASAPKSRGGCRTCKNRRVKCDEAKPECQRCVKSARVCGGYGEDVPRGESEVHEVVVIESDEEEVPERPPSRPSDPNFWERLISV